MFSACTQFLQGAAAGAKTNSFGEAGLEEKVQSSKPFLAPAYSALNQLPRYTEPVPQRQHYHLDARIIH